MVNDIIDGKYEIISKIGSGGTSIVYKARRIADGKIVAVKVIRDGLEDIKEHERHFRMEAEALSQMSHRNVRRILSAGKWNDSLYMVTEFIDGKTLKDIINENGPVPVKTAIDYALQIVAGIEHAHRRNIIHRDIKPQNVIVSVDGTVKIVDFGIARMLSQTTRTMGGKDVVGSVHYISPEQARGNEVDLRTDIYSLGVLMYEMFTGKVPFEGEEAVSIAMKHVNQKPVAPMSVNPNVPRGINDIILKCMEKYPDDRYQSASELREDLLLFSANPEGFQVMRTRKKTVEFESDEPIRKKTIDTPVREKSIKEKKPAQKGDKTALIIGISVVSLVILIISGIILGKIIEGRKVYPEKEVPTVAGLQKTAAAAVLRNNEFSKFEFAEENSLTVPAGSVIRTEPSEGNVVKVNTKIKVVLSLGPKQILAENTIGKTSEEATEILKKQGFLVTYVYEEDQSKEEGTVVKQSNMSQAIDEGSTITLTVIRNLKTAELVVPNILGMSAEQAKQTLINAGFIPGNCTEKKVYTTSGLGVGEQSITVGTRYPYIEGETAPQITVDYVINICAAYRCTYTYSAKEKGDYELDVLDYRGETIDHVTFSDTSEITYEYEGAEKAEITFELYMKRENYAGAQRVEKVTKTADILEG